MNYLAHLLLSDADPECLVGNFMADAVKGAYEGEYSPGLARGIRRHRRIDAFTDYHPIIAEAKQYVARPRRRLAGIFLDIVFDHFLSRHWSEFCDVPRRDFIAESVATLEEHVDLMPPAIRARLPFLEPLLLSYISFDGMERTFDRIALRRDFLAPMRGAELDLVRHEKDIEAAFLLFFPLLAEHAEATA